MISPDGDITVTNDGATIMGQMQVRRGLRRWSVRALADRVAIVLAISHP